ncbi:condensin-2 complex subunit G2-like [Ylistrum balloti]|uniref:condensin-2 complex subunit G2-like n=1 Tax=Ylistrum balloti TaxID=509963 RepID=UPI002905DB6C|nr:condensin-2 complex subunit G2-like [Ylistrum balloti]
MGNPANKIKFGTIVERSTLHGFKIQQATQLKIQQGMQLNIQQGMQLKIQQGKQLKIQQGTQLKIQQGKQLKIQQGTQLKIQQGKQLKIQQGKQLKIKQGTQLKIQQGKQLKIPASSIYYKMARSLTYYQQRNRQNDWLEMNKREELLSIVDDGNLQQFVKFIQTLKSEGVDLVEILSGCSKKQLDKLWEGVQQTCAVTMLSLETGDDGNDDRLEQEMMKILEVLQCVVDLASAAIQQEEPHISPCLKSTAVLLLGLLLPMPETADRLKNDICVLCENWWQKKLFGKEDLITNALLYLLQRSLNLQTKKELKRLWSLHSALSLINISDASSDMLRDLLCQCVISTSFVKYDEGVRFLGCVMSLDPNLTDCLHKIIKNHMPISNRNIMERYGEIYFRAWQTATGAVLEKLESAIQNFMDHAVHARKCLAPGLRCFLSYFHKQRKYSGVDSMLLRLYGPLLWRSLKVANCHVRENAAMLLLDSFPLQDQDLCIEELDQLLQKQFDIFQALLEDTYSSIRSVTVRKLSKILSTFCEFIPVETIKNLVTKMMQDLVWDASSADVRASVILSMMNLLDNQMFIPMLKPVLPQLCNHIHDTSEKVRVAMIDLLLKVKGIRAIKYWDIVPMEHVLARLEIDSHPVVRRIMKLLQSTFMPLDKPKSVQLDRCIALIESSRGAARQFFHHAPAQMSVEDTATYMISIVACILRCIKAEKSKREEGENSEQEGVDKSTSQDGASEKIEDEEEEEDETLTIHNTEVMAGLVEAVVILWSVINNDLKKRQNHAIEENLQTKISIGVTEMMKFFDDPQVCSALINLAGFVPYNSVPTISRTCLSKLKKMSVESVTEDYSSYLDALCKWDKVVNILDLVDEWLTEGLQQGNNSLQTPTAKVGKKRQKSVGFVVPQEAVPTLGIDYVTYMLRSPICRPILTSHINELTQLQAKLRTAMKCVERSLISEADAVPDHLLTASFSLYCKLAGILHQSNTKHDANTTFGELFSWADVYLLPNLGQGEKLADTTSRKRTLLSLTETFLLPSPDPQDKQTEVSRKRPLNQAGQNSVTLATSVLEMILAAGGDLLLIGVGDTSFAVLLANFCVLCLQRDESLSSLSSVMNCLCSVTAHILLQGKDSHRNSIAAYLGKVFVAIATALLREKDHVVKILPGVRNHLMEIFSLVYGSPLMDESTLREIMATVIGALFGELVHASQQFDLEEISGDLTLLPPLSGWLCDSVCKKNYIAKHFIGELTKCVESEAVNDLHSVHGAIHLLGSVANYVTLAHIGPKCLRGMRSPLRYYQIGPKCLRGMRSPLRYYQIGPKCLRDMRSPLRYYQIGPKCLRA